MGMNTTPRTISLRDLAERLVWTAVVAVLTNVAGAALLDVSAWQAAGLSGIAAAIQVVVLYGRQRLAALPNPGDGLPGLPAQQD